MNLIIKNTIRYINNSFYISEQLTMPQQFFLYKLTHLLHIPMSRNNKIIAVNTL